MGGIVSAVKQLTTKRGETMVFVRLDDVTGGIDCVVFAATYAGARELFAVDRIVIVKGRVDHKEGETKLVAQEVSAFESVAVKREVRLRIDATRARAGIVRDLAALFREFPGESPVLLDCVTSQGLQVSAARRAVPRPAGPRLLRRGSCAPRRVGAHLTQTIERRLMIRKSCAGALYPQPVSSFERIQGFDATHGGGKHVRY